MSELKATTVYDAYWKANSTGEGTGILVYLKYEADKVIADLEESHKMEVEQLLMEIVEMKKACNSKDEWCLHTLKENRHQKWKRCLAMAMWCIAEAKVSDDEYRMYWWVKWHKRWLELAEKFKEGV